MTMKPLELSEAVLKLPHMYFSTVEAYKGALTLITNSLFQEVPGPTKLFEELEAINSDMPITNYKERLLAFSETKAFYEREIEPHLK